MARGIWGLGYVTGYVRDEVPQALKPDEFDYWLDEAARLGVTREVEINIPLLEQPITDVELRSAGIDDLEVQVQYQGSNPSWVSKDQLHRLESLLPQWPDEDEQPDREITVSTRAVGFGTPVQRAIVEAAAMEAVTDFYESSQWKVKDVSTDNVGWDLTCRSPGGEVAKVEVKGVSGNRPIVLLTANEMRAAEEDADWVLAVVTRALSKPAVTEFTAAEALEAAAPYVYKADLTEIADLTNYAPRLPPHPARQ